MSNPQLADLPDTLTLAKQGNPDAIAILLNQILNPDGIFARVGSQNDCLGILLEATPVPNQDEMITTIRHLLADLNPAFIQFVKVGGYQPGQTLPAWYEEIELEEALTLDESSDYANSVENWLNQGLASIDRYETVHHSLGTLPPQPSIPSTTNGVLSLNGAHPNSIQAVNEQRFLRFYVNQTETALLPLSNVQQVLKVPVLEILPMPHMPNCVLGIYNWRGEMLWLVDLAQQLGFPSPLTDLRASETVNTIAIQADRAFLGIVVPQTLDIETHNLQQLQTSTTGLFSTKLSSYMQGYFAASSSPVLNAKALIQDPLLQAHYPR